MTHTILRMPATKSQSGYSRSTIYLRITQGLWTKQISLGPRAIGWPADEVAALNLARISGKSDDEYKAAAAYLAFLATKPEQQFLLENTGYIPVTKSTYEALLAEGFYAKEPFINRDIAMKSLTWTEPTELTRGIRLGGMIQIRAEWLAEVEAALAGQKTMQEALDTAAARGNEVLARFAQTYAGKSFP